MQKVWYREGTTTEQIQKDLAECGMMAEQYDNPLGAVNLRFMIVNNSHKSTLVKDCMEAKGYKIKKIPTEKHQQ